MTPFFTARGTPATWAGVILLGVVLAYGIAEDVRITIAVLGLVALVVGVALAAAEPRWAIVALAFGSYATLFEAAQAGTGLPVSKRLALVAVAALVVWRRASGAPLALPALRDVALAGSLLVVMGASTLVAADKGATLEGLGGTATAMAGALLLSTLRDPEWLRRAMWATAAGGTLLAALSLYQQAAGTYDSTYFGLAIVKLDGGIARSGGPFEPNFFAQALVLSLALAGYLALRTRKPLERALGITAAALCAAAVSTTASRGGALALAVMLTLAVVFRRPPVKVIVAGATIVVVAVVVFIPPETTARISSLAGATNVEQSLVHDTSFRGRFAENVTAVYMLRDNPLLGVGSSNFPVRYAEYATFTGREWRPVRQAHNLYLEAFAEMGVVGGTVLVAVLWLSLRGVWNARRLVAPRDGLLAEGVLVGVVGVLTTSIFLHASFLSTLWTAIGLTWAAAAMGRAAAASRPPAEA